MSVIIYGAGGQALMVLELMERAAGISPIAGMVDDDPELQGKKISGIPILGPVERLKMIYRVHHIDRAVIAVGDNAVRRKLGQHARDLGLRLPVLIHPNAYVAAHVKTGDGSVIFAGAVINAHASIGELAIINTHASIDHDCQLGDCVHIAPGATLCGNVTVGDGTLIGAGANVLPGLIVGDGAVVGAGATVILDVPSKCTVVGTPARLILHQPPEDGASEIHP